MSDQDFTIYQRLLNNQDKMYVAPDKKKLYYLEGGKLFILRGDFAGKSSTELNLIVCVATEHC